MLFEKIETPGIAHFSYVIGDGNAIAVIDPRRDIDVYLSLASAAGLPIRFILETHRNEDYVIGSSALATQTGAEIWHADDQLDYRYGQSVRDGQTFQVGRFLLKALHTPGHTPGSMSYLLYDPSGEPWMVFTGDALFAGDVGRTDFLGEERLEEMTELLYESLFNRLLPLGDHVLVCPAHGAGSACGSAISDRFPTTIGLERRLNPMLQDGTKAHFIARAARILEYAPYFRKMEQMNLEISPALCELPQPIPLPARVFAEKEKSGAVVIDLRSHEAFSAAHVPGALSLPLNNLASFAGWYLDYSAPILLIGADGQIAEATTRLRRLGYDQVAGFLAGGILSWHMAGFPSGKITTITVQDLCQQIDAEGLPAILDVRAREELEANGQIPGAMHIHLTELPEKMSQIPQQGPLFIFCGSGVRSMISASLLKRAGHSEVVVVFGGLAGWNSLQCPVSRTS